MAEPLPWQKAIQRQGYAAYLQSQRVMDRQLARVLRDSAQDGRRIILANVGDGVAQNVRRQQVAEAVRALHTSQAELWGGVTRATRDGIAASTRIANETAMETLDYLMGTGLTRAQSAQVMASMRAAAERTTDVVRARLINNIPLSDRVYKTRALSNGWVAREVNRGLGLGESARELANRVAKFIDPSTPGGTSYAAMRLGRTENNNAYHAMAVENANNLPFVEAMQWSLSGSHPKPDECDDYAEMDDYRLGPGVYLPQAVPSKPHPNCFCFVTAITPPVDAFIAKLNGGDYDPWLESNGFSGVSR